MTNENSGLREAVTTRIDGLRRALETSRLANTAAAAGNWVTMVVQNSWLYGWLTAEPEPEVIVIDLRETYTVGPFIRLLDRIIETVAPWYRESTLKRGVDAAVALGERAADTRAGRLLVRLFEPPESPTEDEREQKREPDDEQH